MFDVGPMVFCTGTHTPGADSTKRQHQSQFRNFFENEEDSRRVVTLAETEVRSFGWPGSLTAASQVVGTISNVTRNSERPRKENSIDDPPLAPNCRRS